MHCMLKMQEAAHQVHKELLDQLVQKVQQDLLVQQASRVTGLQGIQGATGIQGIPGVTGSMGLQGITGPAGVTGVQGLQGPTGPPGATGSSATNHDWYDAGTTSPPANINDDIYTNGNVGIGKNNPQTSFRRSGYGHHNQSNRWGSAIGFKFRTKLAIQTTWNRSCIFIRASKYKRRGNKNFVINTLGNVGVGTQTPQKN